MQRVAADRDGPGPRTAADAGSPSRRPKPRRRSPLSILAWLAVALLACFLIAVASGLITDNGAAPTPLASTKVPASVEKALAAGWGRQSSYIGRYRMRVLATDGAAAYRPTSGQLTLFMRVVKTGEAPLPSGILALQTPSGANLVYLTSLISTSGALQATVNGGAFVGPVIGGFAGIRTTSGTIDGVVGIQGIGSFQASYTRFSDSPQP